MITWPLAVASSVVLDSAWPMTTHSAVVQHCVIPDYCATQAESRELWSSLPSNNASHMTLWSTRYASISADNLHRTFVHLCCHVRGTVTLKDTALSMSCFHNHHRTSLFSCYQCTERVGGCLLMPRDINLHFTYSLTYLGHNSRTLWWWILWG